jgi:regulatory protein
MPHVEEIKFLEKGKASVSLDNGARLILYRGELRKLSLREGVEISQEVYRQMIDDILTVRAKKRAMHLLERMDRTEKQLHEKLCQNGYPEECIEAAISYVKKFHYIDDLRYASNYIHCYQDKRSRQRLQQDLMRKGVAKNVIEDAMEEAFAADEREQIRSLLEKKHFDYNTKDRKEMQRSYQFLMRRGFKSSDILAVMQHGGV